MAAKAKPVPDGYHTITPYLVVDGADKVIRFMREAFGAQPLFEPMMRPDGKVMHAEFRIGDSVVMIADTSERAQATSDMLYLYVPNVDAVYQKALKAGATSLTEPEDQFYGDRSGGVRSSRQPLAHRHPYRGCLAGRAQEARGRTRQAKQGGVGWPELRQFVGWVSRTESEGRTFRL